MALFELFIPASDDTGFNITARIEADNWMHALRNGLRKLGDGVDAQNVLCDINESGIDVTEPQSGRVFRIRELDAASPAAVVTNSAPPPAAPPATGAATSTAAGLPPAPARIAEAQPATLAPTPIPSPAPAPVEATAAPVPPAAVAPAAVVAPAPPAPQPSPVAETPRSEEYVTREKATSAPRVPIGRIRAQARGKPIEDLIAELFEDTAELHAQASLEAAAELVLDLAMRVIPSESGSVYVADINASDLFFAAARGPKAAEVMKFRVAIGQGLVGFSTQEGVGLAVSDAEKDPRFFATISKKLGYNTHSVLCAPAQKNGRVYGALQLINKRGNHTFSGDEMNLLSYLAHQFAEYLENTGQAGV